MQFTNVWKQFMATVVQLCRMSSIWDRHAVVKMRWVCLISTNRDDPCSKTHMNQCRVYAMSQDNHRFKEQNICLKLCISQERVHHVTETLNYRNNCIRRVLWQFTVSMKKHRKIVSQELLNQNHRKGDDFLIITASGDVSWGIVTPNKRQSIKHHSHSPSIKKFKTDHPVQKVKITILGGTKVPAWFI